jgi:hypothetical protein
MGMASRCGILVFAGNYLDTGRPIPEPSFRRTDMKQVNEAAEKFAEAF